MNLSQKLGANGYLEKILKIQIFVGSLKNMTAVVVLLDDDSEPFFLFFPSFSHGFVSISSSCRAWSSGSTSRVANESSM
jgi:hypothetical protein